MSDFGVYREDDARLILRTVQYLLRSGFINKPGDRLSEVAPIAPIFVRNDSGEVIPPYAVMQVTGTVEIGDQNYITVTKPSSALPGSYLFNGFASIPNSRNKYGIAHDGPLVRVRTNGAAITPGSVWGAVSGQWHVALGAGELVFGIGPDDIGTNVMQAFLMSPRTEVHQQYQLLTNWFGGIALAMRKSMDGVSSGQIVVVRDPLAIFAYQHAGDRGYMVYQPSINKYYAIQAPCGSAPIVQTTGACCYQSGSSWDCFDATAADCASFGGTFKGAGTSCASTECAP